MMSMVIFFFILLISFVFILLSIAFFTLLERKILSLSQIRVGPNKISVMGIFQPVLDGLKLMIKELVLPHKTTKKMILFFPLIMFYLMLQIWLIIPQYFSSFNLKWNVLGFLIILGLSIYSILMTGNISSSKFGMIGSIRASAQNISYEISLILILFSPILLLFSFNLNNFMLYLSLNLSLFLFPFWWISCIAETNRAPFDLAEGESELISGFNIEYGSTSFIFIFLSEYGMILILSFFSSILFFNKSLFMFIVLFCFMIILRSSFPRIRYDMLMKICWIFILPSSFPLFFSILMLSNQNLILFWSIQSISLICFSFSFLVKLPMFFFHIWLPKAHVEAPTLGSIILAGLLLKLGGFGICFIMKVFINIYSIILIFISSLGCLISCFICCFQSDGKALIAFSSVCHLNFMLFSLLTLFSLSKTFSIFCMLIHGLNSSFMFWLAGTLSHWSLSRNIIWLNSLSTFSISILMMSTFIFLSNFGVPPSLSIFQEIIFFSCIMNSFWLLFFINLIYLMLVCYFSLYILICLNLKQFFQKTICWINMELFNFFMVFMMMNFILLFLN